MRRTILTAGFICAFIFGAQDAIGQCMCIKGPGSSQLPAHEAFKTSEIVFTGEVVNVKKRNFLK